MSEDIMQSDQINKQAAEWFTLVQSAQMSATQRQELHDWLLEHPDHKQAYRQIELVWQSLGELSDTAEGSALRRSVEPLSARLMSYIATPVAMIKSLVAAPKYAAAFTAVCVAVGVLLLSEPTAPIITHYSTEAGELRTITLADSSEITLSAKSQISTRISDTERSVDLVSGEAFFDIAKDRQKPFFVTVNNVSVEVVGTQFNVQKVRDAVSVAVVEGVVNVFAEDGLMAAIPDAVLTAGQKVVKASGQAFDAVINVPNSDLGAWRMGRLIYTDIALADIVADAGRYFDGKIVLQSQDLADVKVTMTLRTDQVSELPQMLAKTLPLKVHTITDDIILLKN
ncbi:MAG: FecR family protein [Porticoccaceae bacterium]